MPQTVIPFGHPLARKVYGAAVFTEITRKQTFGNRLTGPSPTQDAEQAKAERMQTAAGFPFIRVTDLTKTRGDTVSVDMFNILQGKPVVGDKKIAGRMMSLKSRSQDIKINQMRGGVDPGGRMTQQRTVHDLRNVGRMEVTGWWARFLDQAKMVHVAGARGSMNTADWVVPLASDPEFGDIMVNTVTAPTFNRHFYAGDATSLDTLDTADIATLDDIDRLRAAIDEADIPLQPIMFPDDPASMDEPLYVLYVSSRVWHYMQTRTGDKAWRTFLSSARERGSKNPLFSGEPGMWNGILVRKTARAIRFVPGDVVTVATSAASYTETTKTIPTLATDYAVDRCVLLGAQGLAEVWGKDSDSGMHMRWWEEVTDHGNTFEASVAGMGGCSKLRFPDANGVDTDHGIMVLDCVAPDPRKIKIA